jgi:hypothetical protein
MILTLTSLFSLRGEFENHIGSEIDSEIDSERKIK